MPWFDCHTHVVFQIPNVLFFHFTNSSHALMIVNPLLIYLNINLYLAMPNLDMISLKGLSSAALSFHFMINCHYLSLSPIQFEGNMNSQGHRRMWEKQTTSICTPKKWTLQNICSLKKRTLQNFCSLKNRTLQNFCSLKMWTLQNFCSLKMWTLQNICSLKKRTLQNICSLKKRTLQHFVRKKRTLQIVVINKGDTTNFFSLKKRTLQNLLIEVWLRWKLLVNICKQTASVVTFSAFVSPSVQYHRK